MPALYVNVKTVLEYQPRLYVERNYVTIPPHEKRRFVIVADNDAERQLDLTRVGFELSAFNGNTVRVEPDESVILGVGRRDLTCHGFRRDGQSAEKLCRIEKGGNVGYLFEGERSFAFDSPCVCGAAMVLNVCDRDAAGLGTLRVRLNGREKSRPLGKGDGVQKNAPWHAAHPETFVFDFGEDAVEQGGNTVEICAENGWFTLDSFVIERKQT